MLTKIITTFLLGVFLSLSAFSQKETIAFNEYETVGEKTTVMLAFSGVHSQVELEELTSLLKNTLGFEVYPFYLEEDKASGKVIIPSDFSAVELRNQLLKNGFDLRRECLIIQDPAIMKEIAKNEKAL